MTQSLTRTQRLDRLPVTPKHKKLLFGSGIGWALDAMDVGLVSFVIAALAVHWDLEKTTTSWIASVGFIGMAIGASLGGLAADKIGRRNVFAITLLLYGLATGASALAGSVAVLLIFRFLTGLGLGAELPVASTLVSEFAPLKVRGRMVVWLEAFWAAGWILAAIIGTFVVAEGENGWRWGLALGAVPAFYALWVRMQLPESVRFLESRGREEEAEAVVRSFEEGVAPEQLAPVKVPDESMSTSTHIWSPELRARTFAFWTVWFCVSLAYYGAFTWIPSLLVDQGFSLVRSFSFTLIITLAQLPGYALAGSSKCGDAALPWPSSSPAPRSRPGSTVSPRHPGRSSPPVACSPCSTWVPGEPSTPSDRSSTPPRSAPLAPVPPRPSGASGPSSRLSSSRRCSSSAATPASSRSSPLRSRWRRPRRSSYRSSRASRSGKGLSRYLASG